MSCLNDIELEVVGKMEKYGGSFVKALAKCFMHADQINKAKLKSTFRNYWDDYKNNF